MHRRGTILVVDDRQSLCESLRVSLGERGYSVLSANNSKTAMLILQQNDVDTVLLDIRLGEENGLDVLSGILASFPDMPVIMITGFATIETAVDAMKRGAVDYIQKPIKAEKLARILQMYSSLSSRSATKNTLERPAPAMATRSPSMSALLDTIRKVATSNLPVLVCGESGVGKELIADFIHAESTRSAFPIHKLNCAAISESLLDTELFGHEKGSFTGATAKFLGVFERADKSTLFLDEIGDMPLSIQTKILRTLQNREIRHVGGSQLIYVDVRVVAATNKDLLAMVKAGEFREDLLYRLNSATFHVPPLRERREDILSLAEKFVFDTCSEVGNKEFMLDEGAKALLLSHDWPGNVRELQNALQYACAICESGVISAHDFPESLQRISAPLEHRGNPLESFERELILKALSTEQNNKKNVAEHLQISRTTLYKKMKKYGIDG